MQAKLQ